MQLVKCHHPIEQEQHPQFNPGCFIEGRTLVGIGTILFHIQSINQGNWLYFDCKTDNPHSVANIYVFAQLFDTSKSHRHG